jgi:two-component system sensor histidine kinase NreB
MKYSGTDEVHVRLCEVNGYLQLTVRDRGVGFNMVIDEAKGTGLGLYGMRERAELVGGQFILLSAPGEGTTIQLNIPLTNGDDKPEVMGT